MLYGQFSNDSFLMLQGSNDSYNDSNHSTLKKLIKPT